MTIISAEPILSSQLWRQPHRLDTVLATYPRWIHAEGRTHRALRIDEGLEFLPRTPSPMEDPALSRNAASSRAIPVAKMIEDILSHPAVPIFWGKNVAGMQANEELSPPHARKARDIWLSSMDAAIKHARAMVELGIDDEERPIGAHKQIVNRMLEPYMHIRVLFSATEWSNFLALRIHAAAEPHIQMLAREIKACLDLPAMQDLRPGEWHLPFILPEERAAIAAEPFYDPAIDHLRALSTARCASTSYMTVDSLPMTIPRALELHRKLVGASPLHASPAEHIAMADEKVDTMLSTWRYKPQHRNYVGFRQYRAMLPNDTL